MPSNTNLTVDLQRPNIAVVAYGVQGDSLSRQLTLTLIDGDRPWTPPAGALPVVRYGKPDGTFGFYDTLENGDAAISIAGNIATITLAAQALTAPGNVAMQLNFYTAAAEKLSSFSWILRVDPAVVEDNKIASTDYVEVLTAALAKAMELLPEIENAGQYAKAASDAAVAAEQSKNAAAGSASAAAGSATAAGAAAQSASASKQAASESATAAGQAASSADVSKSAAADSAEDAAQSEAAAEDNAEDAEAWAVGKRNGVAVPSTDPTYNNNAEYWAGQAKIASGGGVQSVNGIAPDTDGNVTLVASDVGALPSAAGAVKTAALDNNAVTPAKLDRKYAELTAAGKVKPALIAAGVWSYAGDHTLDAQDEGCLILMVGSEVQTVTIPTHDEQPYPNNTVIYIARWGVGAVNIVGASGVLIAAPDGQTAIAATYGGIMLKKLTAETWWLCGGLTATTAAQNAVYAQMAAAYREGVNQA